MPPQIAGVLRTFQGCLVAAILVMSMGMASVPTTAQQAYYQLRIGYELPKDPNRASEARQAEGRALGDRSAGNQACREAEKDTCRRDNEIAFRKRVSTVAIFWLIYEVCARGSCERIHQLIPLTPDDATDPRIDLNFYQLPQSGQYHETGIHMFSSRQGTECTFRRASDDAKVEFPAGRTICAASYVADFSPHQECDLLSKAIYGDHRDVIRLFLSRVASLKGIATMNDVTNCDPLVTAIRTDLWGLVKSLVENGADPNRCVGGASAGESAPFRGVGPRAAPFWGDCPISLAARHEHWDIVESLVEHHAIIDKGCVDAFAQCRTSILVAAVEDGNAREVQFLLEHGADVNYRASGYRHPWGTLPLHWAADKCRLDIARLLVENGASLDVKDDSGHTALAIARSRGKNCQPVISFLQSAGAR